MNKTFEAGNVIDQHRIAHTWSGKYGRTIECLCGHKSQALYEDQIMPITDENNPERVTQRAHADHVAEVLQSYAEQEDPQDVGYKRPALKIVERSTATKYQVTSTAPKDGASPVYSARDALYRVAQEVGASGEIPNQIMIDRSEEYDVSMIQDVERITITWFA